MKTLLLITGIWKAVLGLPGGDLPFNFEVNRSDSLYTITILNGSEKILVDEISFTGDSMIARLPVFDSEIRVLVNGKSMTGDFINYSRKTNQRISFHAYQGIPYRFNTYPQVSIANVQGRWETDFSPGTADSSKAIGVFEQKENGIVYGTFLTPSGDYRYLEGCATSDSLFLSCFDGAHAFLFKAAINGDRMTGIYLSGNHWKENFVAKRNDKFKLPDPYSITYLKKGFDKMAFTLPDLEGRAVSLTDKMFQDKVVIIQVMGSWCPNCMDESAFFSGVYEKYKDRGLRIVGLSFEKTPDFAHAASNIKRLRDRYHITYPLLIGNRDSVAQTLPMLNKIAGYPTTIYVDKKGKVRKIYTGFSGPATGNEYEKYKEDFYRLLEKLLTE